MRPHLLFAIGASTGGVAALQTLAAGLPRDFNSAVFVVQHIGAHRSLMPELLARVSRLAVSEARDGETALAGHIYVAPSDHHLLVDGDRIRITRGPKEHHTRPAIDPLFRSLAMHAGARAVGVVLTGQLDDGTSGLQAIKASGGRAVVQDPDDAVAPDMPTSACRFVRVDHCVPLDAMAGLLDDLSRQPVPAAPFEPIDTPQNHEQAVFLSDGDPMDHLKLIGMPSTFTCPDCHGALWQVLDSAPLRYRCHTGHGFTLASLQAAQSEVTGDSLWNALRGLAERYMLLDELAGWERLQGDTVRAARTQAAASRAKEMAAAVRLMIETDDVDAIETAD